MGLTADRRLDQLYQPVQAGRLPHRVAVQVRVEDKNDTGEVESTWADSFEVWARYERLSGDELFAAQQTKSNATSKVTMRYRNNVEAGKNRLRFGELLLDIEDVIFDPWHRRLEISTKEAT